MKILEVEIKLNKMDVCIMRDALKVFGSEGRGDSKESIEQLQEQFQKLLIAMCEE